MAQLLRIAAAPGLDLRNGAEEILLAPFSARNLDTTERIRIGGLVKRGKARRLCSFC